MTVTAKRRALKLFIETADEETIEAMHHLFISKRETHNVYNLYRDVLPHLQYPQVKTPAHIPDIVKPFTATSRAKKAGRTKK